MNPTTQKPTGNIQAGQSTYLNDLKSGLPVGTSSSFQQVGSIANTPVNLTPDASALSSVKPLAVPQPSIPQATASLGAFVNSANSTPPQGYQVNEYGQAIPIETNAPESQNKGILSKISEGFSKLAGKSGYESQLNDQYQVDQRQQAAIDTFNNYNQKRLQFAKMEQDYAKQNQGISQANSNKAFETLRRNNSYELANDLLAAQAAQGNYQGALDIIKRKVDSVFEPLQQNIDNLEKFYQLNQNDLSESEKFNLQTKIDEKKAEQKVKTDAYQNTLATLAENGAPASVYAAVDKASQDPNATAASIIAASGRYAQNILDRQVKEANIAQSKASAAASYASAAKARSDMNGSNDAGDNPQLYSGLKPATATAVRSQVSAFKTEPIVQNFSVIQEGRNFANTIDTKTKNPADDQALIYSLAKALDPGSVVREGEYATAQKYTQSWVAAFGKGIEQAINGTGFLTEKARNNIKSTIETKYKSSKRSYDNLTNEYVGSIDNLTGRSDGSKFLKNYSTEKTLNYTPITAPDGQQVIITD